MSVQFTIVVLTWYYFTPNYIVLTNVIFSGISTMAYFVLGFKIISVTS